MALFIEVERKWVNLDQITHFGSLESGEIPAHPEARSYVALISGKHIYLTMPVEQVMQMIEERCGGNHG